MTGRPQAGAPLIAAATLGDLLRVAADGGSDELLPSGPLKDVLQVADQLPPTPAAGFERTLGRHPAALDFAVQVRLADPCGRALVAHARSGHLDALGWSGVPGLLRALGDQENQLAHGVDEVWLEFDTSRGDARPSFFAAPTTQDDLADLVVALREATGGRRPAASVLATIDALRDLPGRVFALGLMLARADDAVRICLDHTGVGGMATVLEACGGSASWLIPRLPRDRVTGQAHVAFLAFELTADGIRDRIGVELIPPPGPATNPLAGWRRLLDGLVAAELCLPSERDDLLGYPADVEADDCPEHWPTTLSGFEALPAGPVPVIGRRLHHVKLSLGATPLAAKVYFGFVQHWRFRGRSAARE